MVVEVSKFDHPSVVDARRGDYKRRRPSIGALKLLASVPEVLKGVHPPQHHKCLV